MKLAMLSGVLIFGYVLTQPQPTTLSSDAYAGTDTCMKCHKMRNKAIAEGVKASPLTHALMDASADGAIEGDFSNAPIKKDDVAFTLCWQRHEQNYLDKDLNVLPATWCNDDKKWMARDSVDAGKLCVGCHTVGYDPSTRKWVSEGVGCESCHGPQGAHAKNPMKVKPPHLPDMTVRQKSMVCGQCHSGGKAKDGSAFLTGYKPGDDLAAVWDFQTGPQAAGRSQRYNEWSASPHADKVACTDCHDQHNTSGQPSLLQKPIVELCGSCHKDQADISKHQPSAKPTDTCATCHMPNKTHNVVIPSK